MTMLARPALRTVSSRRRAAWKTRVRDTPATAGTSSIRYAILAMFLVMSASFIAQKCALRMLRNVEKMSVYCRTTKARKGSQLIMGLPPLGTPFGYEFYYLAPNRGLAGCEPTVLP